ncbi:TetR/AcrR family transcriptional regulator [Actinopolymorpha pittospori]
MSKGAETRTAILHVGVETAYRVGLGGLTIGELARSTGLSKSGLFAHFRSKESLQLEVLKQARNEFIASVIQPAILTPRGEPRVRALFENWLDCVLRRMPGACLFVKALSEFEEQSGPVRDQLFQDHRDLYDSLALSVQTGVTEGQFGADLDPMQFAFDLDGIMLVCYHWLQLIDADDAEARARRAFETLLDAARRPS